MAKKTVALLFGGVSSEYEVSCLSVSSVFENVDREKYEPVLVGITKTGEWYLYTGEIEKVRAHEWDKDTENLKKAFAWNKGFKEYFAVKATPNPFLINILREYGCGCDCSSVTELMLSKAIGATGDDIMFSSNDTPPAEFKYADDLVLLDSTFRTHKIYGDPDTLYYVYAPVEYLMEQVEEKIDEIQIE
mgnify:CR=1 FL=1